jgi:hypothetical protein
MPSLGKDHHIDVKQLIVIGTGKIHAYLSNLGFHRIHPGTSRADSTCHSGRKCFHVAGEHTDSINILVQTKAVSSLDSLFLSWNRSIMVRTSPEPCIVTVRISTAEAHAIPC